MNNNLYIKLCKIDNVTCGSGICKFDVCKIARGWRLMFCRNLEGAAGNPNPKFNL